MTLTQESLKDPVKRAHAFHGRGIMVLGFLMYNVGFCILLDTDLLSVAKVVIGIGVLMFFVGHVFHFFIIRNYRSRLKLEKSGSSQGLKGTMGAALFLTWLLLLSSATHAATKPIDAMAQIKDLDQVLKTYHKPKKDKELSPQEAQENLKIKKRILNEDFDLREMCRLALEKTWTQITPQKRDEFVGVFTQLLLRNAILHSEKYSGEEKIEYLAQEPIPEFKERRLVRTRVEVPEEALDFDIHYAMLFDAKKNRWRIYDIILDQESLMVNYRDQFSQIMAKHSYDYLVQKMRQKLADKNVDKSIKPTEN